MQSLPLSISRGYHFWLYLFLPPSLTAFRLFIYLRREGESISPLALAFPCVRIPTASLYIPLLTNGRQDLKARCWLAQVGISAYSQVPMTQREQPASGKSPGCQAPLPKGELLEGRAEYPQRLSKCLQSGLGGLVGRPLHWPRGKHL